MLGLCQWFHYEDYDAVRETVAWLRTLGVKRLRTGISWADFHRPGGPAWYDWQMDQLREFDVLLSIWHTPPSIGETPDCASPPRRLSNYAAFIEECVARYGDTFEAIELWNEPNNLYKWQFRERDPRWTKFAAMVRRAAETARLRNKSTVLGGMSPADVDWLDLMKRQGVLDVADAVGVHGFPGMWWDGPICWEPPGIWRGWPARITVLSEAGGGLPVWVTETGLATWDLEMGCRGRYTEQARRLEAACCAPAERVYWYSVKDLQPARDAIEGFHVDENEYHLGLIDARGCPKPACATLRRFTSASSRDGAANAGSGGAADVPVSQSSSVQQTVSRANESPASPGAAVFDQTV